MESKSNRISAQRAWPSVVAGFCIAWLLIPVPPASGVTSAELESYLHAAVAVEYDEEESANDKAIRDVVTLALATETREAMAFAQALGAIDSELVADAALRDDVTLADSMTLEQRAGFARACHPVVRGLTWQLGHERGWDAGAKSASLLLVFARQGCSSLTRLEATSGYLQRAASGSVHCKPGTALTLWDDLIEMLSRNDERMPLLDRLAAVTKLIGDGLLTIESRVRLSLFQLPVATLESIEQDIAALDQDLEAITGLIPEDMGHELMARAEGIVDVYLANASRYAAAMEAMPEIRRSAGAVVATLRKGADPQESMTWMTTEARHAAKEHGLRQTWWGLTISKSTTLHRCNPSARSETAYWSELFSIFRQKIKSLIERPESHGPGDLSKQVAASVSNRNSDNTSSRKSRRTNPISLMRKSPESCGAALRIRIESSFSRLDIYLTD